MGGCAACRDLPSCVLAARSAPEGRGMERSSDGDEVPGDRASQKACRVNCRLECIFPFRKDDEPALGYPPIQCLSSATLPCPCRSTWFLPTVSPPRPLLWSAAVCSCLFASSD